MALLLRLPAPCGQFRAHLRGERVFNLFANLERSFGTRDGLRAVAEFLQSQRHIPQRNAFTAPVADLTGNGQWLFVKLDGLAHLAQVAVDITEVAERIHPLKLAASLRVAQ